VSDEADDHESVMDSIVSRAEERDLQSRRDDAEAMLTARGVDLD